MLFEKSFGLGNDIFHLLLTLLQFTFALLRGGIDTRVVLLEGVGRIQRARLIVGVGRVDDRRFVRIESGLVIRVGIGRCRRVDLVALRIHLVVGKDAADVRAIEEEYLERSGRTMSVNATLI